MKLPIRISFRHLDRSDALETYIRERADELDQFYDQIMHCEVIVEEDHRRHAQGNLFHVRIDVSVPGKELVVRREPHSHHAHEDAFVAVRDAFDAMRRQLEDYARKRMQHVKHHEAKPAGVVTVLEPLMDYGRISTRDGRYIYFNRNSVLDDKFDALKIGTRVEFVEERGDEGPQASSVRVL